MSRRHQAQNIKIKVRRLKHAEGLPLPAYQTADAAGFDLVAAVPADSPVIIAPGSRALVPTGLIFELPPGSEAQVRPRSGLAAKFGVTVLNSPGTIDADYRGEVAIILINLGQEPFAIKRGERVAQMILAPVIRAELRETRTLTATSRGSGGFGSTGVSTTSSFVSPKIRNAVAKPTASTQSKSRDKRGSRTR